MRFRFIDVEKATWPVRVVCRVLEVSTSGFYAWRQRPQSEHSRRDAELNLKIGVAHAESRSTYGSPRIHADLVGEGIRISRKRVARLMREQGLRGRGKKAFVRTTDSQHDLPVVSNLLDRDFTATAPNERWVGDVTALRTPQGWLYLAVLLDLYSRIVVGWGLSAVNDRRLALRALEMALQRRAPPKGLLHHTDQGSPYASHDYQKALDVHGITCSMSRRGNCYDNAVAESFFNTLKVEVGEWFESAGAANRELFDFIETFYNGRRRHSSLGYLSPRDFEATAAK